MLSFFSMNDNHNSSFHTNNDKNYNQFKNNNLKLLNIQNIDLLESRKHIKS